MKQYYKRKLVWAYLRRVKEKKKDLFSSKPQSKKIKYKFREQTSKNTLAEYVI